jgi:hypothetical protein
MLVVADGARPLRRGWFLSGSGFYQAVTPAVPGGGAGDGGVEISFRLAKIPA